MKRTVFNIRNKAFSLFLLFTLLASGQTASAISVPKPEDVIVIANHNVPESLELADFYMKHRGIPRKNLIVLDCSTSTIVSRKEFVEQILNPIRKILIDNQLILGKLDEENIDCWRRFQFYCYETHFKYIVLCTGIPLKIPNQVISEPGAPEKLPDIFQVTNASVDSELCLITAPNKPYISWDKNPLFEVKNPGILDYSSAVSVCRIDAPTLEDAKRMITDAIDAESQDFIMGRAYIDLAKNNRDGNLWLRQSAALLRSYGYDTDVIPDDHDWSILEPNEAPAVYLGWYQTHASGPMVSGHSIPKGAIAAHIHSFSASTISTDSQWVGPLLHAGFAVTFGNVYEPYLQLTMRPDRFIEHLLEGYCLGDASLYAQPVLSWQNVTFGDPLYQPFHPADKQDPQKVLKNRDSNPYEQIIAINRVRSNDPEYAYDLSMQIQALSPSLPVAFKILNDYQQKIGPQVQSLIIDYLLSFLDISEDYAPKYFDLFLRLKGSLDNRRINELEHLLRDNAVNWSTPLQDKLSFLLQKDNSDTKSSD